MIPRFISDLTLLMTIRLKSPGSRRTRSLNSSRILSRMDGSANRSRRASLPPSAAQEGRKMLIPVEYAV